MAPLGARQLASGLSLVLAVAPPLPEALRRKIVVPSLSPPVLPHLLGASDEFVPPLLDSIRVSVNSPTIQRHFGKNRLPPSCSPLICLLPTTDCRSQRARRDWPCTAASCCRGAAGGRPSVR